MRTVQMTLDEELIRQVDQAAARLGSTRSAFAREALRQQLHRIETTAKEQLHREGYARKPVEPGEFSDWEEEQVWPT